MTTKKQEHGPFQGCAELAPWDPLSALPLAVGSLQHMRASHSYESTSKTRKQKRGPLLPQLLCIYYLQRIHFTFALQWLPSGSHNLELNTEEAGKACTRHFLLV